MQVEEGIPPWLFFTSCYHDPMLYGYRGLIIEWDYTAAADCTGSLSATTTAFRLNVEDEASFPDEVELHPDDFHRQYCPYRRLVGVGVVERFNRTSKSAEADVEMRASSSLAEFVRHLHGSSHARDQIQPVYRPIAVPPPTTAGDDRRTGSSDDRYAMVDDRDRSAIHSQQALVVHEYPTTTTSIAVTVTPSSPLPVVPEVSAEDWAYGNETEVGQEPVSLVNGERNVTGNGNVEHCVCVAEVIDGGDVTVNGPGESTTVVTQTTIVRRVNGGAVNIEETDIVDSVPLNGSVHGVVRATELADSDVDAVKSPTSDYIIDDANRRTIRSDL